MKLPRLRVGARLALGAVLMVSLVATLALAVSPAQAAEKSFALPQVEIQAAVGSDGSLTIAESRTWSFTGSFSWVEQWVLHPPGFLLTDVQFGEPDRPYLESSTDQPGTYRVETQADRTVIRWRFQAQDETRTFVLRYRIPDAVAVHDDVAELYWQFFGDDWEVPTGRARVSLNLPPGAGTEDIRAWGHGPLSGEVSVLAGEQVTWVVDGLPARTFLEGRVTFPPALVPAATRRTGKVALPAVLAEETAWAEQANRQRERELLDVALSLLLFPLGLVVMLIAWWRFGRERRGSFRGPYYRELPGDYSPAELGVLWRKRGAAGGPELSATLLDLTRRGQITLRPVPGKPGWFGRSREDLEIAIAADGAGSSDGSGRERELSGHEQELLDFLFGQVADSDGRLLLAEMPAWVKRNPEKMRRFLQRWRTALKKAGQERGFWDPRSKRHRRVGITVAVTAAMAGLLLLLAAGLTATGITLIILAGFAIPVVLLWQRRSQQGADDYSKWRAFRRFLTDFSRLDLAAVPALVLWEHYLVFATVLGVAKQALAQMQAVLPRLPEEDRLRWEHDRLTRYGAVGAGGGLERLANVGEALNQSIAKSFGSLPSSGEGRGGGFSSGGGGGMGGGGGRAG